MNDLFVIYGLEILLMVLLVSVWGAAGLAANGLKYAAFRPEAAVRWKRAARRGIKTGLALVVLWCAVMAAGWVRLGWLFVMDRVAVMMPLMMLPALAVARLALPSLARGGAMTALSPVLVASSVHAMLLGTVLAAWLLLFDIPSIPEFGEAAASLAVLAAGAALLYLHHRRRMSVIRIRRPGFRVMLLRQTALLFTAVLLLAAWHWRSLEASRFPDAMSMIHPETFDFGNGPARAGHSGHQARARHPAAHAPSHPDGADGGRAVSVTELTGPQTGEPDRRFVLIAQKQTISLPSGHAVEAWTFNGQVPGPSLVVREGDLVEVELINRDIEKGVTVHWHGVDVPNAEDGVPGVTQDAVMPGQSHIYRFVVNETGTHWYHSHQLSSIQVAKGLFGAFIILPAGESAGEREPGGDPAAAEPGRDPDDAAGSTPAPEPGAGPATGPEAGRPAAKDGLAAIDMPVFVHDWETEDGPVTVLHLPETGRNPAIPPGADVRLRLINSASLTKVFTLNGTAFKVAAIDGWDIHRPEDVEGRRLIIGGGGRYDVTFAMPAHPVTLAVHGEGPVASDHVVFGKDGRGEPDTRIGGDVLDPLAYGAPAPSPFDEIAQFDREFLMVLDQIYFGHYNGRAGTLWAINGEVFPHTPTFVVEEGDLVKVKIVNRSLLYHPMHLHGHHVFVLSRNGRKPEGSPLWLDTVLVEPGETWEVAFRADNPGIWMDHCHVLEHAAWGMSMHLVYPGIVTPFTVGDASGNHPE